MGKSRSRKPAVWQNRILLAVAGALVFLAALISLAAFVAAAIVGPQHPIVRAAVAWTVIAVIGLFILVLWQKWRRRRRSRFSRLPELLALTPSQFEEAVGAILQDSGF